MATIRVLTVVGARPQFIKAAVVSRAFRHFNQKHPHIEVNEKVLHTGQHYDYEMNRVFFEEMQIPSPFTNLNVGSGKHGEMTGKMLIGIERNILKHQPDYVLVYGDTNSTLAGALAASKLSVPVGHIEAGLRSFNMKMAEEINRIVADRISHHLFCPSELSRRQLSNEGITKGVYVVGDVMYDAMLLYGKKCKSIPLEVEKDFVLATIHRAENTDNRDRLRSIFDALNSSPIRVILPLHPRTREVLIKENISVGEQIRLLSPVSYLSNLAFLQNCIFVVTDSGGLQKEAYFAKKKCITVRNETEWVELVNCGANRLVGADSDAICKAFSWALEPLEINFELYGNGHAAERIVSILTNSIISKENF